jgi:hypothetical protein
MRIAKRIVLVLVLLLAAAQIPFVIRRIQTGRLAARVNELNAGRTVREDPKYREYKGIIHAHTNLGGHSSGGFDELIDAANANGLDFVLMTEHWSDKYDTAALTLNGTFGRTLFVGGSEIDTADGDRFLVIPGGADAAELRYLSTPSVLEKMRSEGRLALVTYPEKFRTWDSSFDGIEVLSLHTTAKSANKLLAAGDLLWSFPSYPELTLLSHLARPDTNLARYDETAAARPVVLFAGTDAHSNIGFHLFGDEAGHRLIGAKLDNYATTFGVMREHILVDQAPPITRDAIIDAIRAGRLFSAFDALADPSGFRFTAEDASGSHEMGSTVQFASGLTLTGRSPVPARFRLFRNGTEVPLDANSPAVEFRQAVSEPGSYRVEAYLDQLGSPFDRLPWILSNPIYVR